ncbi:MAG: type VII secretion integral membrane protein EccD [Micromonosporaceae bacterium]
MNAEMCRLVVCGPDRQIDVAVPSHILVADLLPALLQHLGEELADTGMLHGGWVLQRLGATPFDEDSTVASLGLHDGETVHIRPRSEQIPPLDFDDLIDGVATGLSERAGKWRPEMTRWAAHGLQVVLLATGLAALALPGPPGPRVLVAAGIALVSLAAAFTVVHTVGEHGFGRTYGAAGVGYAGLAGLLLPGMARPDIAVTFAGPHLFTGAVAVLAAGTVGAVLLGPVRPFFAAVLAADMLALGGFVLMAFLQLSWVGAASVVLVVGTVLNILVPQLAFRLSGLRLDPLPTERDHVNQDLDPVPSEPLLARGPVVDRYMTALYLGLALPVCVAIVLVGGAPGWAPATLVALVALIRMLAARPMSSGWHRLALAVPAVAGLAAVAVHGAEAYPAARVLGPAVLVPVGVAVLFVVARTLPQRRPMPYWGRAGDLLQTLAMVATLPVLLAVLGVYQYVRGYGG